MPANPEFVAISTFHYAKAGFVRRRKGQRSLEFNDPSCLLGPGATFQSELPAGWSMEILGVGPGYSSCGSVVPYEYIVIRTPQGNYPAYRRQSPGNEFAICVNLNYVRV